MVMNIGSIDLKLLVVFDAIMSERNVSRAARRIGMSQPAMSNALNRLRHMLEDQLFLRTVDGMKPTRRAIELSAPIGDALKQIKDALEQPRFSPVDPNWEFKLALSDHTMVMLLPSLLKVLACAAPQVRLRVQPKFNEDVVRLLDDAEIDLAVGVIPDLPKRMGQQLLFEDHYVCVMRRDHPLAGRPMSAAEFMTVDHVVERPSQRVASVLDQRLKQLGATRRIVSNVSQILVIPHVLRQCDLMACLFQGITHHFNRDEFYISPLPFPVGAMRVVMAWNRARSHQVPNRWIRQQMLDACCEIPDIGVQTR